MYTETGRIIHLGEIQTGVSSRTGEEWAMQDVVIETQERYARKIVGTIMRKEFIEAAKLKLGEVVTLHLQADAHEYNGRYFTDMRILDISTNNMSRFIPNQLNQP